MTQDIYTENNVPIFEAIYGKGLISLGGFEAIDDMFKDIDLTGKTVLDVGSGIGGMAYHLAEQHHCTVIGLELPQWMSTYAAHNTPAHLQHDVSFINYTANGGIPLDLQSIDVCCSKGVLTNVENKLALFQQLFRILKNGGQIRFVDWLVPDKTGHKQERLRMGDMSFKVSQSCYLALLQRAQFQDMQFVDKSAEYLSYVKKIATMYQSIEHQRAYAHIINDALRDKLIQSNNDLMNAIETGQQFSMLIQALKK